MKYFLKDQNIISKIFHWKAEEDTQAKTFFQEIFYFVITFTCSLVSAIDENGRDTCIIFRKKKTANCPWKYMYMYVQV